MSDTIVESLVAQALLIVKLEGTVEDLRQGCIRLEDRVRGLEEAREAALKRCFHHWALHETDDLLKVCHRCGQTRPLVETPETGYGTAYVDPIPLAPVGYQPGTVEPTKPWGEG